MAIRESIGGNIVGSVIVNAVQISSPLLPCLIWFESVSGSFKAASETYQYAPAVRIGDQILISGIVGADAEGRLPPDFRSQAENVFTTLEAILKEAGATPIKKRKPWT